MISIGRPVGSVMIPCALGERWGVKSVAKKLERARLRIVMMQPLYSPD